MSETKGVSLVVLICVLLITTTIITGVVAGAMQEVAKLQACVNAGGSWVQAPDDNSEYNNPMECVLP